ncbi:MAG: membrane dipeptidase [Azospirillaceae bacterium]|nr:membrane dipeptidase [Azospirillaceae bacterium]
MKPAPQIGHSPILGRRQILAGLSAVAGIALMRPATPAWAAEEIDPRVAEIVRGTIAIDTHNHVDVPLTAAEQPGRDLDLAGEMKRSGLSAIGMTFALDYQSIIQPGQAYDRFINGLTAMDAQLSHNGMTRSLTLADLRAAHAQGQPTVVQSVEGAHFLDGKVERVAEAHGRGLRLFGLLHDSDANPPLGDVYTNPPKFGGLTPLGADVIRECNRLGILIDLAHCSAETVAGALKVTTKPVVFSHTGLDTQLGGDAKMAAMMRSRLLSPDHARAVADAGGVVGVWNHLAASVPEYARNIRAMVDAIGIDHVCIGTDTKLIPGTGNGGQGTNHIWPDMKAGFFYAVADALLKVGFNAEEIGKIGGGNFCRVFGAATA